MKIKFTILIILLSVNLYSQKSNEYDYGIPLPPETYQFKKRLINNVSLYTGQPSINIPLYSINLDGMEIPISISYNTGGIKVEEDATSVGLGWSLNIGGQITRNNHGVLDERYFMHQDYGNKNTYGIGRLKTSIDPHESTPFDCRGPGDEYRYRAQFYSKAFLAGNDKRNVYGNEDSRPDEFYYSFFGHSGKFMYSQELRKFITFPLDDIDVGYELKTVSDTKFFDHFNVKLPNGYNLILGKEGTSSISQYGLTPFDQSWQLKKIISPKNKEVVYNYISADYYLFTNLSSETIKTATASKGSEEQVIAATPEWNVTSTKEKLISEIIFPQGKIIFVYGDRLDLLQGAKKLQEIKIYDQSNNLIRKIGFEQSYFNANIHLFHKEEVNKRLRLDAVKFYDSKNTAIENYQFDYHLYDKIPSKSSKAQDHWGYFNGKESNYSLFPKHILPFQNVESSYGFNRDLDTLYTKTFSLKSIKFPEGGVKHYNYENHKCLTGATTANYFDAISNERYAVKSPSFSVSGYSLDYFYPTPSESNPLRKIFYSDPFETSIFSTSLNANQVSILINSNFPFQAPDYKNINAEFNKVEFWLQQKQTDGTFKDIKYHGTISKDENTSGNIKSYFEVGGKGTYRMKIVIVQTYYLSSTNYNYHNSSFTINYRDKVRDDVRVGGLRIKDIKTYTDENLNDPNYTTYFKYLDDDNITSGRMMNVPSYIENISIYTPSRSYDKPSRVDLGIRMSSSSVLSLYKTSGSNVGYTKVSQIEHDNITKKEIKEDHYFSFKEPLFSEITLFDDRREDEPQEWHRGKLLKKASYNDDKIVKEEIYDYYGKEVEKSRGYVDEINYELLDQNELCSVTEENVSKHIYPSISLIDVAAFPSDLKIFLNGLERYPVNKYSIENYIPAGLKIPYFKIYTGFDKLKSKTTKSYFKEGIVEESENYFYDKTPTNLQLTSQTRTNSKGEVIETQYFYPQDPEMASEPFVKDLIAQNRVGIPLNTQTFRGGTKLSEQKTVYDKSVATSNLLLPSYILENKGTAGLNPVKDKKVSYDLYDDKGNVLQYTKDGSVPVALVWGYNKTLPVAKIENIAYKSIAPNLINEVQTASSGTGSEENMLNAIKKISYKTSGLGNTMISTYMYNPLIGVSMIKNAMDVFTYFTYDSFGRLQFVKDAQGNLVSENQYNYKE
ncbi:hypothetical protein [Flavobacterium hungaricum]|uniref:YD repeat-containing protein n=1 Tax=Flavobacterium hungaricum TaxID=2082725 RepID=A0ABR9TJ63_9FLAO|nr:hypothetical protein [Flavobacterium hungaricum]MBE8725375.1 hypothetical protein [Flavobacterium hungaricum]